MSPEQLSGVKSEVQKILDNHLEEDQRFSIQDLDEESTFLLIDLLLEKDDLEREHIRAQIHEKIAIAKMNLELDYEKIMEIKDKLNYLKNDYNDLDNLKNLVNADLELGKHLNDM
jgi:hypothetical protein